MKDSSESRHLTMCGSMSKENDTSSFTSPNSFIAELWIRFFEKISFTILIFKGMVSQFGACTSYDARQINSIVYGPVGSEMLSRAKFARDPGSWGSLPVKFTVSW